MILSLIRCSVCSRMLELTRHEQAVAFSWRLATCICEACIDRMVLEMRARHRPKPGTNPAT